MRSTGDGSSGGLKIDKCRATSRVVLSSEENVYLVQDQGTWCISTDVFKGPRLLHSYGIAVVLLFCSIFVIKLEMVLLRNKLAASTPNNLVISLTELAAKFWIQSLASVKQCLISYLKFIFICLVINISDKSFWNTSRKMRNEMNNRD